MTPYRPAWPRSEQDCLVHVITDPDMGTVWRVEVEPEPDNELGIIGVVKSYADGTDTITLFVFRIIPDEDQPTMDFDGRQPELFAHLVVRPNGKEIWTESGNLYAMCILTGDWTPYAHVKVKRGTRLNEDPADFDITTLDDLEGTAKPPME